MRHDRCPKNTDCHIKHCVVVKNFRRGQTTEGHRAKVGFGQKDLDTETDGDHSDQSEYQRFDYAKPSILQVKDGEYVAGGQANTPNQRQTQKAIQGEGRTYDFGEVKGSDSDLAQDPKNKGDSRR